MKKALTVILVVVISIMTIAATFQVIAEKVDAQQDDKTKTIELIDVTIDVLPDDWIGTRLLGTVKKLIINGTIVISE